MINSTIPAAPTPPPGFDPDAGDFQNISPERYTEVPKSSHRRGDYRLQSIVALGLLTLYLSNKSGWKIPSAEQLAAEWDEGVARIRKAIADLERAGFLVRYRKQLPGGQWVTKTVISSDPQSLAGVRAYAQALTAHQVAAAAARKAAGRSGAGRAGQVPRTADDKPLTSDDQAFPQVGPDDGNRDPVPGDPVHRDPVQGSLRTEEIFLGDQEEETPLPPAAAEPAAAVDLEAVTGGEPDPDTRQPEESRTSALDVLAGELAAAGKWKHDDVVTVLEQLRADGREPAEIARVFRAMAAGEYGVTQSPRRLLAWWPKPAAPATAELEPDWVRGPFKHLAPGTPMCRRHQGEPADVCGKCKTEKFVDNADRETASGPVLATDAARALARANAAAARTGRAPHQRGQMKPPPPAQGPDPVPAGVLFGAVAGARS